MNIMSAPSKKGPPNARKPPKPVTEFLASTPSVSPSQRFNYDGGPGNSNVNPVGIGRGGGTSHDGSTSTGDVRTLPSTPVRGHPESQNEFHLSPIDRLEEDKLICTMVHRGGNDTTMPATTVARNGKAGTSRCVFPFPTPRCMNRAPKDKYEALLESLQTLKYLESLEENDGIGEQLEASSGRKGTNGKIGEKDFEFTQDMFKANNSEAFIAVTHFLFDLLDKAESMNRFRNAWPIYEKKQESLYRRAALDWFKEIVTENPNFFPRSFKVEQLQGLVVNPYGDRFIRFINGFVNFVMHQVTIREDGIGDPILLPPIFTGNSEVTKRQGLIRGNRIKQLEDYVATCERQRVLELIEIDDLTAKIRKTAKESEQELVQRKAVVAKLIETQPEIFPDDADRMLSEEGEFLKNEFKLIPFADHQKAMYTFQTPLNKHVNAKRVEEIRSLGVKVSKLIDFFQSHSRLYTLLLATAQKRISLDVLELELPQELKESQELSIASILGFYGDVAKMCFSHVNETEVSLEIINRKRNLETKLNLLRKRCEDIGAMDNVSLAEFKSQVEFEIQKLTIKLENADWSQFSEHDGMPLSSLFNFSPPRFVDASKITGLTPAISGYLPEIAPIPERAHTLNKSRHSEFLQKSRNDTLGGRSLNKQINVSRSIHEQSGSVAAVGKDLCDSPVSHRPSKPIEPLVLLQPRNNRRSSLTKSKFRLSLPPSIEDDERPAKEGTTSNDLRSGAIIQENDLTQVSETTQRSLSDSQDRMNELLKCFASETPMEQRVPRKSRRRSSLNLKGGKLTDSTLNESSIEDLEGILGIMDVTLSYADFLDVSIDCDEEIL